jgi:hypothetical protein
MVMGQSVYVGCKRGKNSWWSWWNRDLMISISSASMSSIAAESNNSNSSTTPKLCNISDQSFPYCPISPVTLFALCSLLPCFQPIGKHPHVTILALGDMSKQVINKKGLKTTSSTKKEKKKRKDAPKSKHGNPEFTPRDILFEVQEQDSNLFLKHQDSPAGPWCDPELRRTPPANGLFELGFLRPLPLPIPHQPFHRRPLQRHIW